MSADSAFATRLIAWQRRHGRHDLPWQEDWRRRRDPYRVWLSEIMLQQTQVAAVVPYYLRFVARFPDIAALAAAPVEEVMAHWSGLGYYARARNLHRCAQAIVREHGGELPRQAEAIARLPGIGRSTAAAIAAFCFGARAAILDGNVKRVLARQFGVHGFPGERSVEKALWALAEALLPEQDVAPYSQALMDLGATICTRGRPACAHCPVAETCVALREARVGELPAPRPKKVVPRRSARFLILRDEAGRILLERRPPAGIWGGLLCLPEIADEVADLARVARERYALDIIEVRPLTPLEHAFTHFRLKLRPLLCAVRPAAAAAAERPAAHWLRRAELAAAALPAPIRRILAPAG